MKVFLIIMSLFFSSISYANTDLTKYKKLLN